MSKPRSARARMLFVSAATALSLLGCADFAGNDEPQVGQAEQAETLGATVRIVLRDNAKKDHAKKTAKVADELWVSIDEVAVRQKDGDWTVVSTTPMSVDLLSLRGGVAADLGAAVLPTGQHDKVRLHLNEAWLVDGGVSMPLKLKKDGQRADVPIEDGFDNPECGEVLIMLDWDTSKQFSKKAAPKNKKNKKKDKQDKLHEPHVRIGAIDIDPQCLQESSAPEVWAYSVPHNGAAILSALEDGSIIGHGNTSLGFLWNPQDGSVLDNSFPNPGHRAAVYSAPVGYDLILGGRENRHAHRSDDGSHAWSWIAMGCCNIWRYPPAIDTARGLAYWHSNWGVFAINANDGTVFNYGTGGDSGGFISLTDSGAYKAGSEGALTRHERLSDGKLTQPSWHVSIDTNGSPQLRPPAVTKDGGVVVASRGERLGQTILPGRLASVTADGQLLWNHDVGAVTPPVIGAQDRIFVGTQTAQGDQVAAFDVATGIMLWSAAVSGQVAEVLVGDDDLVYVVAATELYGLDQQTGEARLVVHDMPGAGEAILSSGRVIVAGGGQLVAVPVNAQSYDPAASWPVRFHDNQRTANAQ